MDIFARIFCNSSIEFSITVYYSFFVFGVNMVFLYSGIDPGDTSLYINGISVEVDSLDMFQVLDTLKQEEKLSTGFFNLGIGVCFTHYLYEFLLC